MFATFLLFYDFTYTAISAIELSLGNFTDEMKNSWIVLLLVGLYLAKSYRYIPSEHCAQIHTDHQSMYLWKITCTLDKIWRRKKLLAYTLSIELTNSKSSQFNQIKIIDKRNRCVALMIHAKFDDFLVTSSQFCLSLVCILYRFTCFQCETFRWISNNNSQPINFIEINWEI